MDKEENGKGYGLRIIAKDTATDQDWQDFEKLKTDEQKKHIKLARWARFMEPEKDCLAAYDKFF